VLLDQASLLEFTLTGTQLGELRRARGESPPHATPPTNPEK
jgi:hypothetical protein